MLSRRTPVLVCKTCHEIGFHLHCPVGTFEIWTEKRRDCQRTDAVVDHFEVLAFLYCKHDPMIVGMKVDAIVAVGAEGARSGEGQGNDGSVCATIPAVNPNGCDGRNRDVAIGARGGGSDGHNLAAEDVRGLIGEGADVGRGGRWH
jgi:hypothetical protein